MAADGTPADGTYVTRSEWVRPEGRPDAIDEIADQFERPGGALPAGVEVSGWPQRSRGWTEVSRLHPERRAS